MSATGLTLFSCQSTRSLLVPTPCAISSLCYPHAQSFHARVQGLSSLCDPHVSPCAISSLRPCAFSMPILFMPEFKVSPSAICMFLRTSLLLHLSPCAIGISLLVLSIYRQHAPSKVSGFSPLCSVFKLAFPCSDVIVIVIQLLNLFMPLLLVLV